MKRRVVQVTQSPMNERQWLLTLECGHDQWHTARHRPSRREVRCLKCVGAQGNADAGREEPR